MASDGFELGRRVEGGGTAPLAHWGFANETDRLTDVLLGPVRHLKHLGSGPINPTFTAAQARNIRGFSPAGQGGPPFQGQKATEMKRLRRPKGQADWFPECVAMP